MEALETDNSSDWLIRGAAPWLLIRAGVERRHQRVVRPVGHVGVLARMRVESAGLHPVDARAHTARDGTGDHLQRLPEPVVGISHRRCVGRDLGDAIERRERGLRRGVDKREVRLIDRNV